MDKIKPEYYRCISATYGASNKLNYGNFTEGTIYQIINSDNLEATSNFIANDGRGDGWSGNNYKHFTPVTELDWNLQEGIITKIVSEDYSYLIPILKQLNIK